MKLPSCITFCFSSRVASAESDSSNFGDIKSPAPSVAVCSGLLSSFMSRRSGSRGTWDTSATDVTKTRSTGTRPRGDADVVTLATARYLELFAATAKNDEASTMLSDVRGAQDSMRSVRTTSEHPVSRSSTFTAMGRASREPSRLGGTHNHLQLQPAQGSTSSPAPAGPRASTSSTRRSPPCMRPELSSPTPQGAEPRANAETPCQPSSRRSMGTIAPLGPFTNKIRSPMTTGRSRSDRLSPSAAAYLLPAPSMKSIARAQTALPSVPSGSAGPSPAVSITDSPAAPPEASAAVGLAVATASTGGHQAHLRTPTGALTVGGDGRHAPSFGRRSRLQTESGGSGVCVTTGSGACAAAKAPGGQGDLNAAAHTWAQGHVQPRGSSASLRGGAPARLPRRNSIVFSQDGDVTVTGLPPSCLTAGRDPRCRRDGPGTAGGSGSLPSAGLSAAMASEASAPLMCSTGGAHGFCVRGFRDSSGAGCGLESGITGTQEIEPAVLTGSRSHDSTGQCANPDRAGRCANSDDLLLTLNHGSGRGSVQCATAAAAEAAHMRALGSSGCGEEQQQRAGCAETEAAERQQQYEEQQLVHQPAEQQLVRRNVEAAQALNLANSSSDGQRCEWGGSSVYAPSRFSNSSRLTHGNTTAAPTALMSNNVSEPLGGACGGLAAAAAAAASALTTGDGVEQAKPTPAMRHIGDSEFNMSGGHADSGDDFAGFPAGSTAPGFDLGTNGSLLATEARDVTSALSRLQEACMAAVAHGELRSQRLTRRLSTGLGRMLPQSQGYGGGGITDDAAERGSTMGPSRIMGAVGGGDLQRVASAGGAGHVNSASVAFARAASVNAAVGNAGYARGRPTAPAVVGADRTLVSAAGEAGGVGAAESEPWGVGACDADRASPEGVGIVMDGRMLDDGRYNGLYEPVPACAADGGRVEEEQGADDAAEEYRTRMLDVLLKGDFLHDTHESVLPCSEDEDEGVVEYRYGGFELGGGDDDYSFRRQASFMEAVRKCGSHKAEGAGAAGTARGAGTTSEAGKSSSLMTHAGVQKRVEAPRAEEIAAGTARAPKDVSGQRVAPNR